MKPTFAIASFVLLFLILTNCDNSESTDPETSSQFIVDQITYTIDQAAMVELLGNPFLIDMKVILFASGGLRFDADSNRELKIRGKGQLMGFMIYNKKGDPLTNGDHFVNLRPPYNKGEVSLGFYSIEWDEADGLVFYEDKEGPTLLAGKVTVLDSGDEVSFNFNFTDNRGKILTGTFNGKLQKNLIYRTEQIDFED